MTPPPPSVIPPTPPCPRASHSAEVNRCTLPSASGTAVQLPMKSRSSADLGMIRPQEQPEILPLGHRGQGCGRPLRTFRSWGTLQLQTSWGFPGAARRLRVTRPRGPSHSGPDLLGALLDPPLDGDSSGPRNSSQPQPLTETVPSPPWQLLRRTVAQGTRKFTSSHDVMKLKPPFWPKWAE